MERLQGILRDIDMFISVTDGFKESAIVLKSDVTKKTEQLQEFVVAGWRPAQIKVPAKSQKLEIFWSEPDGCAIYSPTSPCGYMVYQFNEGESEPTTHIVRDREFTIYWP
jgi:hypothetical protein